MHFQLQQFEGPLGLLLYLIKKEEMDVMNINIQHITTQYMDYIKRMKELDLEVAGEFIAMAATLIHIKSKMLLPRYNEEGEVIEDEDPRKELVQKLLEYQKFQEASKNLYERPLVGRDVWLSGVREEIPPGEDIILTEEKALFSLISTYRRVLRSVKKNIHKVSSKTQSIASRILEMRSRLQVGVKMKLQDFFSSVESRRSELLISFLSLLELGKLGYVNLYQSEVYGDIYIDTLRPIEGEAISRVEEYEHEGITGEGENFEFSFDEGEDGDESIELTESADDDEDVVNDSGVMAATDEEILDAEKEIVG